jgi:prephenate dehydrogenase
MKAIEAPGTTFKRHLDIAKGLLSEDDYLLSEILFNPNTLEQIEKIRSELANLMTIIDKKDTVKMKEFLTKVRSNING